MLQSLRYTAAGALALLATSPALGEAPPASCAGKFVGEWTVRIESSGQTYPVTIGADGTSQAHCFLCMASQRWTCSGNTYTMLDPYTLNQTLSADGTRMDSPGIVVTRIGPVPQAAFPPASPAAAAASAEAEQKSPACNPAPDAVAARAALDAALNEGKEPDPALVATLTLDGRRRINLGCSEGQAAPANPPKTKTQDAGDKLALTKPPLPKAEARKSVSDQERFWTAPDGQPFRIPAGYVLYRPAYGAPLTAVPDAEAKDLAELGTLAKLDNEAATCGVVGLGRVSPFCEEQRHRFFAARPVQTKEEREREILGDLFKSSLPGDAQ